jgi:hypothetical protein
MVTPGTYKATILSHAISETKAGNPQAVVTFGFEVNGSSHTLTWYGSFSEKALPHTLKALIVCGLKGNNPAGDLDIGKDVLIVVENEADEQGRERNKIRWVNALNSIRNVIPKDMAAAKLSSLEGAVMSARLKLGVSSEDDFGF